MPFGFTEFDGVLCFQATCDGSDNELWKLDADGTLTEFDFLDDDSSIAFPIGAVSDTLTVTADVDTTSDGIADRYAMLAATGDPTSVDDFAIVNDASGTFQPGSHKDRRAKVDRACPVANAFSCRL